MPTTEIVVTPELVPNANAFTVVTGIKEVVEGLDVDAYLCPAFPTPMFKEDTVHRIDLLDLKSWVMSYVVTNGTIHQYVEAPDKVIIETTSEDELIAAVTRHLIELGF